MIVQAGPMCGRYAASRDPAALVEEFGVEPDRLRAEFADYIDHFDITPEAPP